MITPVVISFVVLILLGLGLQQQHQLVYSQAPVTEGGTEVNEIDLPEYDDGEVDEFGYPRITDIQIVEVDSPILEDVQYQNYALDLDVLTYFNCLVDASLPLYQLSDEEETGVDFRAQQPAIYGKLMENCLHDQWLLTPEGQQQP